MDLIRPKLAPTLPGLDAPRQGTLVGSSGGLNQQTVQSNLTAAAVPELSSSAPIYPVAGLPWHTPVGKVGKYYADPVPLASPGGLDQQTLNDSRPFMDGDFDSFGKFAGNDRKLNQHLIIANRGNLLNQSADYITALYGDSGLANALGNFNGGFDANGNPIVPSTPVSAAGGWAPSTSPATAVNESTAPTNLPAPGDPTPVGFIAGAPEADRAIMTGVEFPVGEAIAGTVLGGAASAFAFAPILDSVGGRRFSDGVAVYNPGNGLMKPHNGLDIGAAFGTPIRAAGSGTVVTNGYQADGAGNYLVIDHGNGMQTKYFHMAELSEFAEGSTVPAGAVIGGVGSTGNSTDNHLHFEQWRNGAPVNPMNDWVSALPPEFQVEYQADHKIRTQQRILKAAGFYDGEIDGVFGPQSREAMELFLADVPDEFVNFGTGVGGYVNPASPASSATGSVNPATWYDPASLAGATADGTYGTGSTSAIRRRPDSTSATRRRPYTPPPSLPSGPQILLPPSSNNPITKAISGFFAPHVREN